MRVVLDSNVLVAALGSAGLCDALLRICIGKHDLFLSEPILVEVRRHLHAKFKMPASLVEERIEFLRSVSSLAQPAPVPAGACRDPDDLVILGTAVAANADALVTGDKDLLSLTSYNGIPILTPRDFYGRVK